MPKKPKKPGLPKLPKGDAKARTVLVRCREEDVKRIETSAKASNQTASEWIRSTLAAALEG